jgi:uncharacterized protein (TIGR03067 family)
MWTRRAWMGMGLGLTGFFAAGRPAVADEAKDGGDLKKLEGKWTAPSREPGEKVTYTFRGDKLKVEAPSRSYEMTVILDASSKPEKSIDFRIDEGPDDAREKTCKGIYKFDGDDKFIFCFRGQGDRPEKYEQVGFEQILTELKREKK